MNSKHYEFKCLMQWGSVIHQMAAPVPSMSCCVLNHRNLFYPIQNALAFNQDMCCHLALCLRLLPFHWDKSAACFCQQVAAWVPDIICSFNLMKNHKIANNSAITYAREKINTYLESSEFLKIIDVCLAKLKKNIHILLNKISNRFLQQPSYLLCERSSFSKTIIH
jgi:hypothetical protein